MKALSLWQPWASLMVHGMKRIETRGWYMRHRGPLLIHAAKKWDEDLAELCHLDPTYATALTACGFTKDLRDTRPKGMPFGAIVGRVEVVDCVATDSIDKAMPGSSDDMPPMRITLGNIKRIYRIGRREIAFGDYSDGRFGIVCTNPVAFSEPISYRGSQGLFDVPDHAIEGVKS